MNIDREVGTPATKIAPAMGMEAHSLSRILKNLEAQGYIKRVQDLNDKRLVNVFLTDKGKEAKDVAKKVVKKFLFPNKIVYIYIIIIKTIWKC